jgi:hypothetical protein
MSNSSTGMTLLAEQNEANVTNSVLLKQFAEKVNELGGAPDVLLAKMQAEDAEEKEIADEFRVNNPAM